MMTTRIKIDDDVLDVMANMIELDHLKAPEYPKETMTNFINRIIWDEYYRRTGAFKGTTREMEAE